MSNSNAFAAELTPIERFYCPPADESRIVKPISPQALASRRRAAQRNHEAAMCRDNRLTMLVATGDAVASHLLGVTHG